MKSLVAIVLALVTFTVGLAQTPDTSSLSKTPAGNRVLAYFKAFNSGDEKVMAAFFTENLTQGSIQARSVEQRLPIYRQIHGQTGSMEITKVLAISDTEIKLMGKASNGDKVECTFEFAPAEQNKLVRLSLRPVEEDETPTPAAGAALTEADALRQAEEYVNGVVKNDRFSGVVLIAKNSSPLFKKAYGQASKEFEVPNRTDTRFNFGSIGKSFTQIAIGQLVAQKKLAYEDLLIKYLPDYPNRAAAEKITVRHLLMMTSGVGDIFGENYQATPKDKLRTINDYIPLFANKPLAFEPGTQDQYSNGGYILLGAIIEKVSGKSYYDYVRENIFQPLGMTNTEYFESDKFNTNVAQGYTTEGIGGGKNERRNNVYSRPLRGSSAGGGYSTVEDLLKLSVAWQTGKVFIPQGDPLIPVDPNAPKSMGIAGGAPGLNAVLEVNSRTGYTIVVMSNYDPPSAIEVGKKLRSIFGNIKPN